jgi:hypothetical protein
MGNTDVERALDMIGLVPDPRSAQQEQISTPEQAGIESEKSPKLSSNEQTPQEVRIGGNHRIPASAFKYKIPVPTHETD